VYQVDDAGNTEKRECRFFLPGVAAGRATRRQSPSAAGRKRKTAGLAELAAGFSQPAAQLAVPLGAHFLHTRIKRKPHSAPYPLTPPNQANHKELKYNVFLHVSTEVGNTFHLLPPIVQNKK
jgi:hypothetical protein